MKLFAKSVLLVASAAASIALLAPVVQAKESVVMTPSPALAAGSTYVWEPVNEAVVAAADPAVANEITEARLKLAVENALAAKGYRKALPHTAADLSVSYFVVLKRQNETKVYNTGGTICGWRGCINRWPSGVDVKQTSYTQGTLVIDLVDRSTGQLVWRASSDKRVDAKDVTQAKLNAVVARMTKSLPAS